MLVSSIHITGYFFKSFSNSLLKFVFLLALIFYNTFLFSQNKELRFNHINTNNGLSSNSIRSIIQDNMGFIWIGTSEGLNRYDGYNNKIFEKVIGDSNSIGDNMVYDLYLDSQNKIWVGTQNGISLYNINFENFTTYILDKKNYKISTSNRVRGIDEDSQKQLFAVTELGALYTFDRDRNCFDRDTHRFISIKDFKIDREDNFWFGGSNGLYFYNKKKNKVSHYTSFADGNKTIKIDDINTLYEEGDTMWVGTTQGRVLYVLKKTMEIHAFQHNLDNTYYISEIFKGTDGLFYIGTSDALFIYNKQTDNYISYNHEKENPYGINSVGVNPIFEDIQHNIWFGTTQGGINLSLSNKAFNNYNRHSKSLKLDLDNINVITEDSQGRLWLGSYIHGISVIDPRTGKSTVYMNKKGDAASLSLGTVSEIFEDSKKNIWIGTYVGTLQKYNPVTNTFISYNFPNDGKNPRFGLDIRSIIEDEFGNLWLIPHGSGLIKFNPQTGKSKHFRRDINNINNTLPDDWPFQLIFDSSKKIWIATPSGLSNFNPLTEKFQNYFHNDSDSNSLCNNFVNVVLEDSQKNLWIGTSFGLDLFDRKNKRFIHFNENDGLPSNLINGIVEYKPGELWISTGFGLSKMNFVFDTANFAVKAKFKNFNTSDNLQDLIFLPRSVTKTRDNKLIFGGENGIVMFDPQDIKENTIIPNVYISDFKLYNKSVAIGEFDSLLKTSIIQTKEIQLKYYQNFFTLEYVAINYISKENNKFRYKLEGFDTDWIDAGAKREATYTNLDPGKYTFKVIASNNDGHWNTVGASIKIVITPPFWNTWWFKILIVLVIATLTFWYYTLRVKNLREQNILLEQKVDERTIELKDLNNELNEKNKWISAQNKEITEQYKEINNKNEEILAQTEQLEEQKAKVETAYEELKQYRNKLEELVDERTRELVVAKDKAEESDKLKSSFLANMSHEIRTPLNAIIGFSNLILEEDITPEERDSFKQIISSSSNALLRLINDIIDFSKIEAGHVEIFIDEVPIFNIVSELKEIYNLEINSLPINAEEKLLELIVKNDNNLDNVVLLTDELRLKQIISILLNNAIKFTNSGTIEVGCKMYESKNAVEFYVKDTGIGISKENLSVIFERFRKVDDGNSNNYRGAGLGLSIAKHLITMLGGEIKVISEPGKGALFTITIPQKINTISKENNFKTENAKSTVPDLRNKTILVAEDDYSNFAYIERLLNKASAIILHAKNGREVLKFYHENTAICLILMDIKMPEMSGFEAFAELQILDSKIPVIAQTAYAFSSDIQMIKELGFDDYISKPINPEKLYALMAKHLI